jgi:hypothetical protein
MSSVAVIIAPATIKTWSRSAELCGLRWNRRKRRLSGSQVSETVTGQQQRPAQRNVRRSFERMMAESRNRLKQRAFQRSSMGIGSCYHVAFTTGDEVRDYRDNAGSRSGSPQSASRTAD